MEAGGTSHLGLVLNHLKLLWLLLAAGLHWPEEPTFRLLLGLPGLGDTRLCLPGGHLRRDVWREAPGRVTRVSERTSRDLLVPLVPLSELLQVLFHLRYFSLRHVKLLCRGQLVKGRRVGLEAPPSSRALGSHNSYN